uniref:Cytochrome P450 n=1 Tax=Acrobeloides nanus TaxID=290746 RepID=A0A914BXD8_9BILA
MHEELDRVIGSDRLVNMDDKAALHYTNAVINEIQRLANIAPQTPIHETSKDVTIHGHLIPKGTSIIPQLALVLMDEEIFPRPEEFRPERYLNSKGELTKCDALIPFSIGKRICAGESLARMELFLFIANVFNQYKILAPPGKMPSLKPSLGGIPMPKPYKVKLVSRFGKHGKVNGMNGI